MANFCTNCGNPVGENDGFCINCGQKILKIQGQTQPKTLAVNSGTQPAPKPLFKTAFQAPHRQRSPHLVRRRRQVKPYLGRYRRFPAL